MDEEEEAERGGRIECERSVKLNDSKLLGSLPTAVDIIYMETIVINYATLQIIASCEECEPP